ncbi:MAG: VOC family protein [Panacibacter sp.]
METDSKQKTAATFAPILYLNNVADAIQFYKAAFAAKELRRWSNDDGSVHVAEMTIENALFRLHEEVTRKAELSPHTLGDSSVIIGLFVENPDEGVAKAVAAGATETSPVKDYDYGYRQGNITDPFGHHWTIEKSI